MTNASPASAYGGLIKADTLKIERLLPGAADRVWSYIVDDGLRAKWLASGVIEARAGASFELVWRNDQLTDPPGARPEGFPAEHAMKGRVIAADPPRTLEISWGDKGGSVLFELEPRGERTLLTLTHRGLPDRANTLNVTAGWHTHLDILACRLAGVFPAPFWPTWQTLKGVYEQRLPEGGSSAA